MLLLVITGDEDPQEIPAGPQSPPLLPVIVLFAMVGDA
jgi:hypothetical protein